ncbi:MAG: hypothetical protein V2B15_20760 [Bacteroidota bacterium]
MKKLKQLFLLLCVVFLPLKSFSQTIIASFENQEELQNTCSTKGVNISLSADFPALGAYSCKAVFPENGGTFYLNNIRPSTLRNIENSTLNLNEALLCFIWTTELARISLILEDSLNQTFTKQYALKQGANHVQLRLSDAKNLDWKRLKSIGIHTNEKYVFYFDYIALDQYQPVLAQLGRWDAGYTAEIKSSHYDWGSDLANGPIRSYSISPVFDGRGIIELAERLDLQMKVTTIGRSYGAEKYGYGDFYMRRSPGYEGDSTTFNLAHNYIAEDLLYSPEFDVIIWPGLHKWDSYPQIIRDAIFRRVKSGTGLLLLFPISDKENSDLWDLSPLKSTEAGKAQNEIKDSEMWSWPDHLDKSEWSRTKQHYITRGVAFEAFPWEHMGIYPYQNNQGDVLLETSQGNPVLAVRTYGKGRIVALAYPERGLLPRVDDPWETGLNYPYWEYMWSLVARSVIWASDREPGTCIQDASRTRNGLGIQLSNGCDDKVVAVQIIDEFGIIEEEMNMLVSEKQTRVDFPINRELNGGNHIANIQLKGKQGVCDWYSLMFQTNRAAEIISVENMEPEIPVGENVRSTIVLKSGHPVKGSLTARLYDNYDRLVDEQSEEVSFQGEKIYSTVLSSENILTHLGRSEYFLYINDHQTDHQVTEHFFLQPRSWDDYDVTMYHFGPNPVPGTWPATDRQLKALNVTTLAAYTLTHSWHANYKIQAQTRIKGVESPDGGPDLEYYRGMKKKYLETNDKSILQRKYGLKEPVYLNAVRDDLTSMISRWKKILSFRLLYF